MSIKQKLIASFSLLALCMVGGTSSSASPPGAKDMFAAQLHSSGNAVNNIGLSYSIELHRGGKRYKVDSRFPFQSGDQIRFHVRPNIDGYMYVVLDARDGSLPALLFPRPDDDNNRVKKGATVAIPEHGVFTFDENTGVESLKLVLSQEPLEQRNGVVATADAGRSVVVRPKSKQELPQEFLIDFAALEPETPVPVADGDVDSRSFLQAPALTMVNMAPAKPLVVDLLLKHQSGKHHSTTSTIEGSSPVADKWAVVIGISDFKNPRYNLHYPDKDARDFAAFLTQKCHFAPDHVRVLTNSAATRERILTEIGSRWLPDNARENDLVCIYFATHGTSSKLDVAMRNFLMAYDTDPLNPFATGIELQDLARTVLNRLQCKRVVLVLDTCHSGAVEVAGAKSLDGGTFAMQDLMQGTGHLVIASAAANQIAHDSNRYQNGIFTRHLIDGLAKYPRLHEAFNYTRHKVQEESLLDWKQPQTPVLKDAQWQGEELRLAVPPAAPRKPVIAASNSQPVRANSGSSSAHNPRK